MDEGPFRVSRPAARRAVSAPSSQTRPEEAPQPRREQRVESRDTLEPSPVREKTPSSKKSDKKVKKPLLIVVIAVAVLALGFGAWSLLSGSSNGIDNGKYQAVFLTNGQHYFGKLGDVNDKYMKLTDIYYLQRSASDDENTSADAENIQQSAGSQNNLELKKLGDEIHGPEDEMIISRENILYYENLKPEGQAVRAIEEYKKTSN